MEKYFNKSVVIDNPLRIFFLCGSTYNKNEIKIFSNGKEREIIDKRRVLKEFIEREGNNFKTIILEENFMFSDDRNSGSRKRKLNYKSINLNSLKKIELITSLFSDYILIVHESFSTAAEIGLFSTSQLINKKLVVLTPLSMHTDEDYISGFMNLAYKRSSEDSRIRFISYNPGIYNYHISERVRKLHTYFIENRIEGNLANELSGIFSNLKSINLDFNPSSIFHRKIHSFYRLEKKNINIVLNSNELISYLLALFNITDFVKEIREQIDLSQINKDSHSNRYKFLFNQGKKIISKYLKNLFYNTIKIENPNIDETFKDIGDKDSIIRFSLNYNEVKFDECLGYFIYLLYAMNFINISSEIDKFIISNDFIPIYKEYEKLLGYSTRNTEKWWSK